MNAKFLTRLLILITLINIVFIIIEYSQLPDLVASHFSLSGEPDSFMNRDSFTVLKLFIFILIPATFLGVNYIIGKVPNNMINLPNRDYWLSDERKAETIDAIKIRLLVLAIITQLFMTFVFRKVYDFNTETGHSVEIMPIEILIIYFILIGLVIAEMLYRFRKPDTKVKP
ncbi:MAG: DUF1648 domain-containing protein [Ignavibacteriales bacterium]|nr:DUF1648 domain-containing protein [Ignavibacteriales bacterium]MCF8317026.1 DUF1648 domain-containing protein [Ignavibacteriales bacterium]MCF8438632.1 DUF1648 domain-containing protein [Ignavibacteriales bacterium]